MRRHAKAPSAGSTEATGDSRGLFRRALATRAAFGRSEGSGAPSPRRAPIALIAVLALIAAFTAAPASASEVDTISDVSYTSAQATGKATASGFITNWVFEYSTDEATWSRAGFPKFIIDGSGDVPVDAELQGLKGGTKYFVRLMVETEGVEHFSPGPNPDFTTLPVDPPTIPGAVEASPVFSTSAKAIGKVKRPANPADPKSGADAAFDVNCHFEYITDDQYKANELASAPLFEGAGPPVDCAQNPIKNVDAGVDKDVFAQLTGLTPSTTYHLRLVAENAGGVVTKEAAGTFTTAPKVAAPTVTAVNDASEVKFNTTTLTGKVLRPAGADPALDVNCHFEYVTDAAFQPADERQSLTVRATGGTYTLYFEGQTTAPIAFDASAATVQAELEGLSTIGAANISVSGGPGDETGTAPYAIDFGGSLGAKDVEQISVDPSALEEVGVASAETAVVADGHVGGFENPTTVDCEQSAQNPIKADGETEVSAKPGLVATTKYHFRLVAENEGGSDTKDATNTFTTPEAELPTVTIDPVEGGTFTTAHVTGTVTLDKGHTSAQQPIVQFSSDGGSTWSTSTMRFSPTFGPLKGQFFIGTLASNPPEEGLFIVEGDLTGLQPSTTYQFRTASTYSSSNFPQAEANGEVAFSPEPNPAITTEPPSAPPTAENLAATDVTATSAHFSATVNPNAPAGPLSPLAKKAYETKWHFECTPECKDANGNEIGGTVQGEEGAQPVSGDAKRLEPGTEYMLSLIVSSEGGGETVVETFDTDKSPPSVKQTPGASDGEGGYTLQGVVNPNNETVTACEFKWGPNAPAYAFSAPCSPMPIPGAKPTTVEAHLTGLNPDVDYHSLLVVTYGADLEADSGEDQKFKATLAAKDPCPANEQQRIESNSLTLPECRAYELVTPMGKEGFGAGLVTYDGGDRVAYNSGAGNIAKSGQNSTPPQNQYVAARTAGGWQTIPNLNGASGSLRDAPLNVDSSPASTVRLAYSSDLSSSVWRLHRQGEPDGLQVPVAHLRRSDGTFAVIGNVGTGTGDGGIFVPGVAFSADLSHLLTWAGTGGSSKWGPGVYEFLDTGMGQPRRVDLDNTGAPISGCVGSGQNDGASNAIANSISDDGRVIVFTAFGGCGGTNPPADELWARVNTTTTVDVSASRCDRIAPACNAPTRPTFLAATRDSSRFFFFTTQQLVNADTDQTNDIYACDIPSGDPAPTPDKANHCSAFRQVSTAQGGAKVEIIENTGNGERILPGATVSEDGSTVYFTAQGVLAENKDALGEEAVAGDHNLYAWRTDASHPDGQTAFVARLVSNDLSSGVAGKPQATPDGRYLVFTTASRLLDTDTDTARDIYRYDADTGALTRASTNVLGVAGNGDAFPAAIGAPAEHHSTTTISDDGTKIVFTTTEALSQADGNAEPDVYLWTPARVSLISTGSSGFAPRNDGGGLLNPKVAIDPSGADIYFETSQALTPADGDSSADVYDARIGGGFSFAQAAPCSGAGGACQSHSPGPALAPAPATAQSPADPGNVKPCPKVKVRKKNGKCAKKPKKHSDKKHHGKKHSGKKASHKQGGGK